MSSSLASAVAAYTAGVDALLAADVDASSHRELVEAFSTIETASRRVPMAGYTVLARLAREANPKELGATSLWKLIAYRCRMSKGEAQRRVKRAGLLGPRRALNGEPLAPQWEHTAAAHAAGTIGDEHVEVIGTFFKALPASIDATTRGQVEQTLAEVATGLGPTELAKAATHLLGLLHPDGELSEDDTAKKCGLTLGRQQPDGTSYLGGWISAKMRALLEPVQAKFGQSASGPPSTADEPIAPETAEPEPEPAQDDPFAPRPEDPPPPRNEPVLDTRWRTRAQYTHDAIQCALETLLRSGTLGNLNGLPTTVVVTTTLQDLEAGAGYAVTAGGSRLPIRDLIEMAANAHHYLAVFDGHTSQALHLGRAQRCATGAQKLMLFARDRGCTCPGCDVPFYGTQAHHAVADWKHGGQTDVDDMTLACGADNRMVDTTGLTTRRRDDGRIEWIPPPELDTGQTRINDIHHPERLIAPREVQEDGG
jgi:uncharacterized protein DUF222